MKQKKSPASNKQEISQQNIKSSSFLINLQVQLNLKELLTHKTCPVF